MGNLFNALNGLKTNIFGGGNAGQTTPILRKSAKIILILRKNLVSSFSFSLKAFSDENWKIQNLLRFLDNCSYR